MAALDVHQVQHFHGITFGTSKRTAEQCFITQVESDWAKDELAKNKKIDLLRVSYKYGSKKEMKESLEHFLKSRQELENSVKWFRQCVKAVEYMKRDADYKAIKDKISKKRSYQEMNM
jgi:hypothetical protein